MSILIFTKSRKDLVRKQKAVIGYVVRKNNPTSPQVREAFEDFQRWSKESGIFKDTRGREHIAHFEKKGAGDAKKTS